MRESVNESSASKKKVSKIKFNKSAYEKKIAKKDKEDAKELGKESEETV
jgi:hypothetical protein